MILLQTGKLVEAATTLSNAEPRWAARAAPEMGGRGNSLWNGQGSREDCRIRKLSGLSDRGRREALGGLYAPEIAGLTIEAIVKSPAAEKLTRFQCMHVCLSAEVMAFIGDVVPEISETQKSHTMFREIVNEQLGTSRPG
jgi:hypothetical protein